MGAKGSNLCDFVRNSSSGCGEREWDSRCILNVKGDCRNYLETGCGITNTKRNKTTIILLKNTIKLWQLDYTSVWVWF